VGPGRARCPAGHRRRPRKGLSATTATKIFFGALDEMATNWVLSRRKHDLRAEADAVVDLFINGVKRP